MIQSLDTSSYYVYMSTADQRSRHLSFQDVDTLQDITLHS